MCEGVGLGGGHHATCSIPTAVQATSATSGTLSGETSRGATGIYANVLPISVPQSTIVAATAVDEDADEEKAMHMLMCSVSDDIVAKF